MAICVTGDGRTIEFGFGRAWTGTQFESLEIFAGDIKESIERNGLKRTFDYINMVLACRMLPGRKIILNPCR